MDDIPVGICLPGGELDSVRPSQVERIDHLGNTVVVYLVGGGARVIEALDEKEAWGACAMVRLAKFLQQAPAGSMPWLGRVA